MAEKVDSFPPSQENSGPLAGIPRTGLRGALRKYLNVPGMDGSAREEPAGSVPSSEGGQPSPKPDPLIVYEERFGSGGTGFPEDLFGPDFQWDSTAEFQLAFLDIETCGLWDEPIFLIGILKPHNSWLQFWRLLARDPSGEPALIRKAVEILGTDSIWVSFNGRSFDGPRLRRRASIHGIQVNWPAEHRDLLLLVRRRWRHSLPNCKLSTVERRLLGLERGAGDVPGREVPERYWDFVRSGDLFWIHPVLEHNRRDVTAMVALYRHLQEEGEIK